MSESLILNLQSLLGERSFVALVETFGGTRLYIPHEIPESHEIARTIGVEQARRLSRRHAPACIRVPLAREYRARHYRAAGRSNAEIARKLGITETGVDKLFGRMDGPPAKGSAQFSLFDPSTPLGTG